MYLLIPLANFLLLPSETGVVLGVRLPKMSWATAHHCQCCSDCALVDVIIPVVAVALQYLQYLQQLQQLQQVQYLQQVQQLQYLQYLQQLQQLQQVQPSTTQGIFQGPSILQRSFGGQVILHTLSLSVLVPKPFCSQPFPPSWWVLLST